MKPTLNTGTSLVDYLKSSNKDSSFNSRASLATQFGITGYTGSADQNTTLLKALQAGSAPKTVTEVKDVAGANAFINGNQVKDVAVAEKVNEVPTRGVTPTSYTDLYENLQKTLTSGAGVKPTATNFEDEYKKLTSESGISDLESQVNDLTNQEKEIRATFRQQKYDEQGKPVAMNVIEGRVSEEERQANERLDTILRQKDYAVNQLKTKYDVVDKLMTLKKLDYQTATDNYNTAFSQNLQMFNTVKGIADSEKSNLEREQDNARANAQIIYSAIQSGGLNLNDIGDDQKLQLTKLELEAGLPAGFYANLQNKNPKADIVTSTSRDVGGKKYVDVIMRNPDGSLSTKSMYVGAVDLPKSTGNNPSETDIKKADVKKVTDQLQARAGADGKIAPEDYTLARKQWVNAGYTSSDFDERFATSYLNPDSYESAKVNTKLLY